MIRGRASTVLSHPGPILIAASLLLSCATGVEDDVWGGLAGSAPQAGGAENGGSSGKGGAANGGSNTGGSSNKGGASTGGASSGGTSNGGSSTGGSTSKGGSSSGGSSTGGSSTGGSSTGGSSSGGSAGTYPGCEMGSTDPVCDACFQAKCGPECATCSSNIECGYLLDCLNTCDGTDPYCEDDCTYYYSGGVDDLIALLGATSGCVTINCSTECQ